MAKSGEAWVDFKANLGELLSGLQKAETETTKTVTKKSWNAAKKAGSGSVTWRALPLED
jgi:hypothetical protein